MRRIIPVIFSFMIMVSWACHDRIIVYPPPMIPDAASSQTNDVSPATPSLPSGLEPSLPSGPVPLPGRLVTADAHFRQGDYPQAIQGYDEYLKTNSQSELREGVLFNLGLSHALSTKPGRNLPGARKSLNQLIKEFPDSRYRGQAELILNLISQVERLNLDVRTRNTRIEQLEEELKRLKEIDLNRRPSRP